ncbi:hypothetical protein NUG22_25710, partial [Saccharothrix longispora]
MSRRDLPHRMTHKDIRSDTPRLHQTEQPHLQREQRTLRHTRPRQHLHVNVEERRPTQPRDH